MIRSLLFLLIVLHYNGCYQDKSEETNLPEAYKTTEAKTTGDHFISWKEHLIDDAVIAGFDLAGSDGLQYADIDMDGFEDIVSVHELDITYDGIPRGYIRIAFGSDNPNSWQSVTLAMGKEAGGAEDVTINDFNNDGLPDIVAACELAHLIYFQNPGKNIRDPRKWEKLIPSITLNRGSFIRVFSADINQDGFQDIIAANKGDQLAQGQYDNLVKDLNSISIFQFAGRPLSDDNWVEHSILKTRIPINARPYDIDGDGDIDIIAGSRGDCELYVLENKDFSSLKFEVHKLKLELILKETEYTGQVCATGFNMDLTDFNKDGRKDILLNIGQIKDDNMLAWLEQPSELFESWKVHPIGFYTPDELVGLKLGDINDDGRLDIMTGGYSRGARDVETNISVSDPLGRLAWFEQLDSPDSWKRHEISRRKRGMYDQFIAVDLDQDGDLDFITTRGNSFPYDGVIWLEQLRSSIPSRNFISARTNDSEEMPLINLSK